MAAASEFHLGDVGNVIRLTITEDGSAQDISTVTTKTLRFRTPRGNFIEKTASFYTNGTDGKIQYTTEAGFFDANDPRLAGDWQVQAYLAGLGAFTGHSTIAHFTVLPNLNTP